MMLDEVRGKPRLGESVDVSALLPLILPAGWGMVERVADGAAYRGEGLVVLVSADVEQDGRRWLHVSVSRPYKMPSYDDLVKVKTVFIGADREAYQLFVPAARHYNKHPYCLHLWSCLDAPDGVLPDFTRGGVGL